MTVAAAAATTEKALSKASNTQTAAPTDSTLTNKARSKKSSKQLGTHGEELAARYLLSNNFTLLERNWRCAAGEADIIATEDNNIVFIEIKTRHASTGGFPEDAITPKKRRRYEKIALLYLCEQNLPSARIRFDVIAITVIDAGKCFLRHHRDAFSGNE